ncbi:MAG: TOBE domain-containing protein, partial [Oscillospiraceae bacterium]|nr:TOBE domain-containing protein [Oscillospiraceae bacterium]
KQRVTMRSEITQIHRETGATTIYVTHDQTEAMTMADRIVVMKLGYVQQIGTPYDLYFNPSNMFVAGFIGEPPMNFIESTVNDGQLNINDNIVDLVAIADKEVIDKYEHEDVVFGFRPEAIKLVGKEDVRNAFKFSATVELTELLGDNTNVYVDIRGVKAILKVEPHDSPAIDAKLEFAVPFESVYLFDKATEKRIKLKNS